nr:palindromic element RPE3 domain-containing protein [Rickettsia typhi]
MFLSRREKHSEVCGYSNIQCASDRSRQDKFQGKSAEFILNLPVQQQQDSRNAFMLSLIDNTVLSRIDILLTNFHNLSIQIKKILLIP